MPERARPCSRTAARTGPYSARARRIGRFVGDRRLHRAVGDPIGQRLHDVGKGHVHDPGAERTEHVDRLGKDRLRRRIDIAAVPGGIDANAQAFDSFAGRGDVVRDDVENRGWILRIRARNRPEKNSSIDSAARHRPDMIQACCELENAMAADAPPGRLQAGHAVGGGWPADRAAGVGGQRAVAQPRRRRHAGPAGRYPRPIGGVPRVLRRRDRRMMIRVGAFGELQLSQQHGTGLLQAAHDRCILARAMPPADRHPCSGRPSLGPAQVLHCDRHTVQRPAIAARNDFVFCRSRLVHRIFSQHHDVGIQRRIQTGDAIQLRARHVNRRDVARSQGNAECPEVDVVQIRRWNSHCMPPKSPPPAQSRQPRPGAQSRYSA
jgi:hypothetical protein